MTAVETYQAVLHELRYQKTSSMTPTEFNHHYWVGTLEWVKMVRWAYDEHDKSVDDISMIVVATDGVGTNPALISNTGSVAPGSEIFLKPSNYFLYLSAAVQVKYYSEKCQTNGTLSSFISATKLDKNSKHEVESNKYTRSKPVPGRLYLEDLNNVFRVKAGSSIAEKLLLTYIKYPQKVAVDPTTGASVTNPEFGDSQMQEIIKWTAASYLENLSNHRLATMTAIQNATFTQFPKPNQ